MKKTLLRVLNKFGLRAAVILLVLTVAAICLLEFNIRPILMSMAEARVRALAIQEINAAILECTTDIKYDDLVTVLSDNQGNVAMLKTNSAMMNALSTRVSITVQRSLSQLEKQDIAIPLGSLSGVKLMTGWGPLIHVDIIPVGSVQAEYMTEFQSAGINQTRHRIFLKLTAHMRVVSPSGANPIEASAQMVIAESIIVGEVPSTYLQSQSLDEMLNLVPQ